ncbi:MAG: SRPBCC domain-containing protein [Nitrospirota bacterium]
MKEIRTEIVIKSNLNKVWDFFTDFSHYPEWNPFIYSISGNVSVNNIIKIRLTPPDAKPMTFKPKILTLLPKKELRWLGHFIIPGLFDGEHIFEFIENKDGTITFIQRELFSGILVPLFKKMLVCCP